MQAGPLPVQRYDTTISIQSRERYILAHLMEAMLQGPPAMEPTLIRKDGTSM